jgi:hypothetical protein
MPMSRRIASRLTYWISPPTVHYPGFAQLIRVAALRVTRNRDRYDQRRHPAYWRDTVALRLGTKPTGIRIVSFIEAMSTTDTSLVTGLAT